APARGVVLALTGRGDAGAYVEVRRGSITGPAVWIGTLQPGASRRFRDATALYVRVGWTPSVAATVNGHAVALEGGTANFRVTRAGATRIS
ncbi:MAG: RodZ domain-containing protein, partial [Actinomycetota bacterium]